MAELLLESDAVAYALEGQLDTPLSVNTYVYEAIQRKYRNSVIRLARTTLRRKYGDSWEDEVRRPFKRDWPKIKAKADVYRETGEVSTPLVDELDYLGVNHFYNLFDHHFDVMFAGRKFPEEMSAEPKNAVLRWSKMIRNARDPLSHPGDVDLSILDAIQAVDSARRIVRVYDGKVAAELHGICDYLIARERIESSPKRALEDSLPPRESGAVDFIGRVKEIGGLHEWFIDPSQQRWLLAGAGGKGKTAIAYQFACQIRDSAPEPYEMVLWLSAKRRRFLEGAIVAIDHPDFKDLESAVNKLLVDYGWGTSVEDPLPEKRALLLKLLDEFPALLVVDDIDSIQEEEDDAVAFFTLEVPHTRSKVLYTSRDRFPGMNKCTLLIGGFGVGEVKDHANALMEHHGVSGEPFSVEQAKKILDVTEGSPLYIEELLRVHARGVPLADCLKDWRTHGKSAREFSLRREFGRLKDDPRKVLLACAINRQLSSVADLEAATSLTRARVLDAMDDLKKLFLVPPATVVRGVPQYYIDPNTRMMVLEVMSEDVDFDRITRAFMSLRGEILLSGKRRADVKAYFRQAVANAENGRFHEAEQLLLDEALAKYPDDPDLLGQLGWLYARWRPRVRAEDARKRFSRAAKLKSQNSRMYWHWWRMEADKGNWEMATVAAHNGVENCPESIELQYSLGYSRSRFGKALEVQFQQARAETEFRAARSVLDKARGSLEQGVPVDDQLASQLYRAIVIVYEALLDYVDDSEARTLKQRISRAFRAWRRRRPGDSYLAAESSRMKLKYPDISI